MLLLNDVIIKCIQFEYILTKNNIIYCDDELSVSFLPDYSYGEKLKGRVFGCQKPMFV